MNRSHSSPKPRGDPERARVRHVVERRSQHDARRQLSALLQLLVRAQLIRRRQVLHRRHAALPRLPENGADLHEPLLEGNRRNDLAHEIGGGCP